MADTKRMPKPMTKKQIAQYQELKARLIVQSELIMAIFHPLNDREHVIKVKFDEGHPGEPLIEIWYHLDCPGVDCDNYFSFPESYLGMTADELEAEKKRIKEEEERKKAEMVARAKAARERRIAEKERKEKDKRYQKYLELKAEFEGKKDPKVTDKPKKKSVYECAHFEYEYDDFGKYRWCHNEKSGTNECDCDRIYAQQFCPFYKKGKLRGKWVISDEDIKAAEEFKKQFEGKE